jgi:hypothetical protein
MTQHRATIDPPCAVDLLLLVADFLAQELAPAQADGRLRYRALVAANLLRIARRELDVIDELQVDPDGYAVPAELIAAAGSLQALAADLADGRRSLTDPATFTLAVRHVDAKLRIAVPEALAPTRAEHAQTPHDPTPAE